MSSVRLNPKTFAVAALCLAMVLASCGLGTGEGSPSYSAGYVHGCGSGFTDLNIAVSYYKDEARYGADANYRKGWQDGHAKCYEEAHRSMQGGEM